MTASNPIHHNDPLSVVYHPAATDRTGRTASQAFMQIRLDDTSLAELTPAAAYELVQLLWLAVSDHYAEDTSPAGAAQAGVS